MDTQKLKNAALSGLRAFIGGAIVAFAGFSYVPNLAGTNALGVAVIVGGATAVVRLIQEAVPGLSTASLLGKIGYAGLAVYVDSFIRAFIGALATFAYGVLTQPNLSISQAAVVGALTGGLTAAVRAVQALLTGDGTLKGAVTRSA